jgi:hypothetical protein
VVDSWRGKMTPLASQRPGLVKVQEVSSIGLVLKESWCWSSEGWSCTAYCSQLLVRTAEQLASPTQLGLLAGMVWMLLGRISLVLRFKSSLGICRHAKCCNIPPARGSRSTKVSTS